MQAETVTLTTNAPEETRRLGESVGKRCAGGEVFLLDGDLGAGKTCFAQGLARGLEVAGEVTSPTFVLHCQYAGRLEFNHIDAYRLEGAPNLGDLGFDELFGMRGTVCAVEWPQMIASLLPRGCIHVTLRQTGAEGRNVEFRATDEPGRAFVRGLREENRSNRR